MYCSLPIGKADPTLLTALRPAQPAVLKTLKKYASSQMDLQSAEEELLRQPYIRAYRERLRNKEKDRRFQDHFRSYVASYSPDRTWEISTTNRYKISSYEGAITCRSPIKEHSIIQGLCGTLARVDDEDPVHLALMEQYQSIVHNCASGAECLFLGPARFLNHDCDSNAEDRKSVV